MTLLLFLFCIFKQCCYSESLLLLCIVKLNIITKIKIGKNNSIGEKRIGKYRKYTFFFYTPTSTRLRCNVKEMTVLTVKIVLLDLCKFEIASNDNIYQYYQLSLPRRFHTNNYHTLYKYHIIM